MSSPDDNEFTPLEKEKMNELIRPTAKPAVPEGSNGTTEQTPSKPPKPERGVSPFLLFEKRQADAIADQIKSGKLTRQEAIEALREIAPEGQELPPMISAADLCANPPPTPPELIEGVLHQGSKLVFGGGSKSFKTWSLLQLAISVATGQEWLGFPTTAGRVLYLNFELPDFSIEKRIRDISFALGVDVPDNLTIWNLRGYATDAEVILPKITRQAKCEKYSLIVLDPLYKLQGEREGERHSSHGGNNERHRACDG